MQTAVLPCSCDLKEYRLAWQPHCAPHCWLNNKHNNTTFQLLLGVRGTSPFLPGRLVLCTVVRVRNPETFRIKQRCHSISLGQPLKPWTLDLAKQHDFG